MSTPLESDPISHQNLSAAFCPTVWSLIMESELELSSGECTSFESKANQQFNYCVICLC